jgi:putative ABC transport system permease protein
MALLSCLTAESENAPYVASTTSLVLPIVGARRTHAVALIVRLALTPVAIGVIVGLAFASFGSRVLVTQLYGVSPLDPLAFAGTAGCLALTALLAAWLPARRAAGVDPIQSLRSE